MRRIVAALMIVALWAAPLQAETVELRVLGMVCAFCAQGIERHFRAEPSVADVSVDLESKLVAVQVKPNTTLEDAVAIRIIEDAGYKVAKIERSARSLDAIRAESGGKK